MASLVTTTVTGKLTVNGPAETVHIKESDTRGAIRLGGANAGSTSRIYIQANGDNSYIDSYGNSAYKALKIDASTLKLNDDSNSTITTGTGAFNVNGALTVSDQSTNIGARLGQTRGGSSTTGEELGLYGGQNQSQYPILSIAINNSDTTNPAKTGISLYNAVASGNTTPGAYSPSIAFSAMEDTGSGYVYNSQYASIIGQQKGESVNADWQGGDLTFWTRPVGNTGNYNLQERLRITNDGKVGIGATSPAHPLVIGEFGNSYSVDPINFRQQTTGQGAPAAGQGISWAWTSANTDDDTWAAIRCIMPGSSNTHLTFSTTTSATGSFSEKMRIQDDGNVGIGSTNPGYLLDVNGTANIGGALTGANATFTSTTQPMVKSAYNATHYLGIGHSYVDMVDATYDNDLELRINGAAKLAIDKSSGAATFKGDLLPDSNGGRNLGSSGAYWGSCYFEDTVINGNLTFVGPGLVKAGDGTAAAPSHTFRLDADTGMYNDAENVLRFTTAGTHRVSILADGKVGIGTTNPGYLLHVDGTFRVTGASRFDSGVRIGGGGQNYAVRTFDVAFTNGVANQKADLTWGNNLSFWGWIEISLTATYSNQNSPGVVTKRFYVGLNPSNAIYTNEARYSDVGGATPDNFAISNVTWDSTNSRYRIQIVHRVSTGNTARGVIKVFGGSSSQVDNMMNNFSIGSVYTTDTTAFAKPVIQLQAPNDNAWVDGNLGIGSATPTTLLEVAGSNNSSDGTFSSWSTTDAHSGTILFTKSANGTIGTYAATADGERLGTIAVHGSTSGNTLSQTTASIYFFQDGAATGARVPSRIEFWTSPPSNNQEQRMVIRADGNVGIGTTNPAATLEAKTSTPHNFVARFVNTQTSGWGTYMEGGGDSGDYALLVRNQASSDLLAIKGDGAATFGGSATFSSYLNTGGMVYVTQAADNDGIRFRGYDDVNGYYGRIGLSDVGYLRLFAEGNRSIELRSGRQIRFYTSLDNSTYTNSVTFNMDGSSTFGGALTGTTATFSGSVGIGTTDPGYLLDVNGAAHIADGISSPAFWFRASSIAVHCWQPKGGWFHNQTNVHTGAIRIKLPPIHDAMVSFWVDVYDYRNNESFSAYISGYPYLTGGYPHWSYTSAVMVGGVSRNFTVRFGDNNLGGSSTEYYVYIGETTDVWNHPQVVVRDVFAGYYAQSSEWEGGDAGWGVSFATSFENVVQTQSNTLPYGDYNKLLNTPALSFLPLSGGTLTGALTGTTATFSGAVGIGTTNPLTYKLYVNGTTNLNGALAGTTAAFSGAVTWASGGSANANTAYTYSQVGHLPLAGGTLTGQLNLHAGSYEGSLTFGSNTTWRCGIRQHDDGDAELRIWAKSSSGMIVLATGYNGEPAAINRPTDGLFIVGNNVGIGNFSAADPTYKLDVKGTGNFTGALTGTSATFSRAQTTAPFTTPFLKLIPSSTTNTTGLTSITLGTSTLDNYGYSISAWRAGSSGNPYLKIMRHFNSAAGVDVMVMDAQGDVGIGTTNPGTYKLNVNGTVKLGALTGTTATFTTVTAALAGNATTSTNTTGNAATATILATARNIGGVSFNGSANINLPGVNSAGTQNTSGNAATATVLATGRTIAMTGDVTWTSPAFSGSGNVTAAATIATGAVDIAMLSASGTPSASTYLCGNNTWAAVSSGGGGTVTSVTTPANSGLDISESTPDPSITLDFAGLTDMTGDIATTDEVILLNTGSMGGERRKAFNELKLSKFNNDSSWTNNAGTVTSITAGGGLSGGAITSSGTIANTDKGSSQNIFKSMQAQNSVGTSLGTCVADTNTDTFVLKELGNGVNLTVAAASDTITIGLDTVLGLFTRLDMDQTKTRQKIRLYGTSNNYCLGFEDGYTFGGLGGNGTGNPAYVLTAQNSDTAGRGFWWGDAGHSNAQGAMAVSVDGRLTVATAVRVGFGESDTVEPGSSSSASELNVNGTIEATAYLGLDWEDLPNISTLDDLPA